MYRSQYCKEGRGPPLWVFLLHKLAVELNEQQNAMITAAANKANRHKNALSHSRAYNYRQRGEFHSRLVGYSAKNKSISKLLPLCAQKAWLDKKDDLKATKATKPILLCSSPPDSTSTTPMISQERSRCLGNQ